MTQRTQVLSFYLLKLCLQRVTPSSPQKGKYEHNRRSSLGGFYGPVLKVTDFGEGGVKWSLEFSAQLARKGKQVDRAHSFATTKL